MLAAAVSQAVEGIFVLRAHRQAVEEIARSEATHPDHEAAKGIEANIRSAIAQQDAVDVALWQLELAAIGLIGVGFSVFFAQRAFREAKRSADTAVETLETENRAWIELKVEPLKESNFDWSDDRCMVTLRLRAFNRGSTPALRTTLWAETVCEGDDWEVVNKFIDSMRAGRSVDIKPRNVFPRGKTTLRLLANLMRAGNRFEDIGAVAPIILACARYWTIFDDPDDPPRLSIRAYTVRGPKFGLIYKDECPMPADQLVLEDYLGHAGHLD